MAQEERKVQTLCRMCGISCGIDAYFRGDKLVKWEPGAFTRWLGGRCPRWGSLADFQYSTERLTHPLRKVNSGWQRISWDEAFDIMVSKLNDIKKKYGPEVVSVTMGHPHVNSELMWILPRFCEAFGTPNIPAEDNVCFMPRMVAEYCTFGDQRMARFRGAKCVIFWSFNPFESSPAITVRKMVEGMRTAGAKFIVVDPRRTELAKMADIHLQVRPGSDGALALGMMNVIISEELYDKEFVEKWTVGFDKLAELVKDYPPARVAEITWIPAELIIEAARMYATSKPAALADGVGTDQHTNTFQTNRAWCCLEAIMGNVDKEGGSTLVRPPLVNLELPGRVTAKSIDGDDYRLYHDEFGRKGFPMMCGMTKYTDAVFAGEIRASLFIGKEMVCQVANANEVTEALNKLDFLVVMDIVMSETAKLADIVLPAASFLERNSLRTFHLGGGLPLLALVRKCVEPLGKCMSDISFVLELAKRLDLGEYFPWENEEELLDEICRQLGTSLDYLRQNPGGYFWEKREYGRHEREGFDTESGKVELYSEKLKGYGHDPLPTYIEPAESPVSTPDVAKDYPLVLTTGGRTNIYEQSQLRWVPKLRAMFPDPLIEINPEDARKYGLEDGDLVDIVSPRGRAKMKAKVTDDMMRGVIHAYHGWPGEGNINIVTPDKPADPVTGGAALRSSLCRVESLHKR